MKRPSIILQVHSLDSFMEEIYLDQGRHGNHVVAVKYKIKGDPLDDTFLT